MGGEEQGKGRGRRGVGWAVAGGGREWGAGAKYHYWVWRSARVSAADVVKKAGVVVIFSAMGAQPAFMCWISLCFVPPKLTRGVTKKGEKSISM